MPKTIMEKMSLLKGDEVCKLLSSQEARAGKAENYVNGQIEQHVIVLIIFNS